MRYILLILTFWVINMGEPATAQTVALKTNLLYGAYALTPNLGGEVRLDTRLSLDLSVGYNPWNRKGTEDSNRKAVHLLISPELRYWLDQPFKGHFFGVHTLYSLYNISGKNLPLMFGKGSKEHRYEGFAVGGGLSYGYQWSFAHNWMVEGTIGTIV